MSQAARKYMAALIVAVAGYPVSPTQGATALEEIVVTAQRREQSPQDVPISLTVFSTKQLKELGVDSTIDLAGFAPGLTIGQNTGDGDFAFVSLRGVTMRDFADTNEVLRRLSQRVLQGEPDGTRSANFRYQSCGSATRTAGNSVRPQYHAEGRSTTWPTRRRVSQTDTWT